MDNHYMRRALDLAQLAEGDTTPNPGVGAVLVARNRIIGEGFHSAHGKAHAEVMAIRSVRPEDVELLPDSVLYVTLEPCCVFGRTPPCTDLILSSRIPKVVISCIDQSPGVNRKGIHILREHGIEVVENVLHQEGAYQALARNTYVSQNRPYVILKMAVSQDGFIGQEDRQVILSNAASWRLVHRIRHRVDAILVGTRTALIDNPRLTNRLFWGVDPLRVVPDFNHRLQPDHTMFGGPGESWVIRHQKSPTDLNWPANVSIKYLPIHNELSAMLTLLASAGKTSVLVEGGASLIRSFVKEDLWDEAIISSTDQFLGDGIPGPTGFIDPEDQFILGTNKFNWFRHPRYKP